MHSNYTMVVYSTGDVIKLTHADQLPGSSVIGFIRCSYDAPSFSGKNHYYSYSLFDENFEQVKENCLQWKEFKCFIAKRDKYSSPFPSWASNQKMRVEIRIENSEGDYKIINFKHTKFYGDGFILLFKILKHASVFSGLPNSIKAFKNKI